MSDSLRPHESHQASLLSHEKELNGVSCSDVEEPRACHKERSKSEREKPILYISTYIWSLEKWCWRAYWKGQARGAEMEDGCVDTGAQMERAALACTHHHVYQQKQVGSRCMARARLGAL